MTDLAKNLSRFFDRSTLLILAVFLLLFIPLYPKLPLLEIIPGYLVKLRIEDLVVGVTGMVWLIQSYRNRITWRSSFLGAITIYAGIGLLSILSGIFILQTIPMEPLHIGKSVLHFFRYLEYFSVFFFMFGAVTSLRQTKLIAWLLSVVVVIVTLYAYGQLHWSWPVFSTMNREFSKGTAQALGENARVQSTFAGHYDMAAFLVILLPYLLAVVVTHPRWWPKVWFATVAVGASWLLVESGSKFALVAGLIGSYLMVLLYLKKFPRLHRSISIISIVGVLLAGFSLTILAFNLSNPRLAQSLTTLREAHIIQQLPPLTKVIDKATRFVANQQPTDNRRPIDVEYQPSLGEAGPTWSENTLKYGLSLGIRLDALWPQALGGLAKNFYLGSGYGTLNKTGNSMFVEADSTDNNILRTLGETGVLGFITFYGVIWLVTHSVTMGLNDRTWITRAVSLGLIGAAIGLLIDAMMIDVFVASKVAFTFWALAGLSLKTVYLAQPHQAVKLEAAHIAQWRQFLRQWWPFILALGCLFFLLHRDPIMRSGGVSNFTANPSATAAVTTVRCWLADHQWQLCGSNGPQPSPTSYLYGGLLVFFIVIWNNIGTYYYANLCIAIITVLLLFLITRQRKWSQLERITALTLQVVVYFLSTQFFSPVDANLGPFLIAGALLAYHRWQATGLKRWLSMSVAYGVALLSILPTVSLNDYWFVFSPLWSIALVELGRRLSPVWHQTSHQNQRVSMFFGLSAVMLVVSFSPIQTKLTGLMQEYRGLSSEWPIQSVRVANDIFAKWENTKAEQPTLLTTANPEFYDFYRTQPYNVTGFPADLTRRNSELAKGTTYVSDFMLSASHGRTEFETLDTHFKLQLVALGCDELCNLYHIQTDSPPKYLTAAEGKTSYSFVVYNHEFDQEDPTFTKRMAAVANTFSDPDTEPPDFLITTGQTLDHKLVTIPSQPKSPLPVFFSRASRNANDESDFYSLRTPGAAFLFIAPNHQGNLLIDQKLALYNELRDIKKDTEISSVFVVTHQLNWLAESKGYEPLAAFTSQHNLTEVDSDYRKHILPKLREFSDKQIFILSADFKPPTATTPSLFYQVDERDGVTYIVSSATGLTNDVSLKFDVTSTGGVTIVPQTLPSLGLSELKEYGVQYWAGLAPGLQLPSSVEVETRTVDHRLLKVGTAVSFNTVLTLLFIFWKQIQKQSQKVFTALLQVVRYQPLT